ncbi:MAG: HEAT repeat domain-containing protein [Gemmatimonadaceae bacterium]|nr:HEAT repeat domain-containing protein [Gemmatimonadaceae bacterium]
MNKTNECARPRVAYSTSRGTRGVRANQWLSLALMAVASMACTQEIDAAPARAAAGVFANSASTRDADVTADVATLLSAARGAPAPICALAARAVGTTNWWTESTDAPRTPLASAARAQQTGLGTTAGDDQLSESWNRLTEADHTLLLSNLHSADLCVREIAVRLLATERRGQAAGIIAAKLVDQLQVSDAAVREVVTFGLGLLAPSTATEALMRRLRDDSAGVRANAAWALGRIEDGKALSGLVAVANDPNSDVRTAAIGALGRLDSTRAIPALLRALQQDSVARVRRVAAWALGQLHDESTASSALAGALSSALSRDGDVSVREMCAWALGELNATSAADRLIDAAERDRSPRVRETAVWALGEIESAGSAAALGTIIERDTSLEVRRTAAWALGQLDLRTAPKGLVAALTDRDDRMRLHASWALSEIRDPSTVSALKAALAKETHPQARRAQLRGILSAGGRTDAMMAELLQSNDPMVREAAIRGVAGGHRVDPWPWPWPRPRPFP